jgi:Flp pilus assembly protein TadD
MRILKCKKLARYMASIVLTFSIAPVLAQLQSDSGNESGANFQGVVRYDNNVPAPFVQVELWTDGESSWRTITTTDRMGKFRAGVPCMVIQYKIETPGYRPVWGRVDVSVNPCRALEWITLKKAKSNSPPEGPATGVVDARIAAIPAEAKTEFDLGQGAINGDDFSGAIPHLQKAIEIYPKYAEAYQLLGVAQLKADQGPQAEATLLKAIQIEDRMPQSHYLLGVLYAKTNRLEMAEKPLNRFAELDPQNPDAQFELAKVTFALKKFPEAETHARNAIKLKEGNPGVYVVLGYALLRQKKGDDARHAFQHFLKYDSSSPMAADVKNLIAQIDEKVGK